jgi:hypothetical protein
MAMSSLEPYGQRRGTSPRDARGHDDERWHVRLTDDDVKLMTLEQLDDAYRLSIVDSETALWKPGMREWQPLRVVAGLGPDDEEEAVEVDVEPEITRVGPTPYDVTPHAPIQRMLPAPSPPFRPSTPPARSTPPPPRLVSTHRPAPIAPAPRSVVVPPAPVARSVAPVAMIPSAPAPAPAYPQARAQMAWNPVSVPPVALSVAPGPYTQKGSGGFGRLLLAVAFLTGSAVSLYRNDVLLDWARAGHLENQFLSAEHRLLGGPAFGTVRAVATSATLWEPAPTAAPVMQVGAPEASKPAPAPEAARATETALSTPPVAHERNAPPDEPKAEPKPKAEPPSKPAALPSTSRTLQSRPTTSVAKNTPPVRTTVKATGNPAATPVRLDEDPPSEARAPKSKKEVAQPDVPLPPGAGAKATLDDAIRSAAARKTPKKKKSAGSEYDPLNPDL